MIGAGPDGRSRGCGLVEFADATGAQRAMAELTGSDLGGRKCVFARTRSRVRVRIIGVLFSFSHSLFLSSLSLPRSLAPLSLTLPSLPRSPSPL